MYCEEAVNLSFPCVSAVKNPSAAQETQEMQVQSPDWKDALEKGVATHFNILPRKTPWTEEAGELYSPRGQKELDMTETAEHIEFVIICKFPQTYLY